MLSESPAADTRTVRLHQTHIDEKKLLFASNSISTTKYTILTFLPKNLFEQFSRLANFYFLIVVLLLQADWSPIIPAVAILPLSIVVAISAIREGIEDILRYKSDQAINSAIAHRLTNSQFIDCRWDEIYTGDVIMVKKNEQIPADIVMLLSSEAGDVAFVDTCNLDGESNLKIHQAIPPTTAFRTPDELQNLQISIVCDKPNNKLYTLNGYFAYQSANTPIDNKQAILRGSVLRNCEYCVGAVIYTGKESKIMMNSMKARTKRSYLEKTLNAKIFTLFALIFVLGLLGALGGTLFDQSSISNSKHWYFYINSSNTRKPVVTFFRLLLSHIVIINAMIPVSLYVTLEIVRVLQALFVMWDQDMYDEEQKIGAVSRTSNISDDLGKIKYIFSDKTGTLTRNVMSFEKCSIRGKVYTKSDHIPESDYDFLWLLSLCHSAMATEDGYESSSPDEVALVSAASNYGFAFMKRSPKSITVRQGKSIIEIEVLAFLEFSSERKRSSIIIRDPNTKKIILYCKGADDLILSRAAHNDPFEIVTKEHLKQFSTEGLRTLCCAYCEISEDAFASWSTRFNDANCSITNKEEKVNEVASEVEKNLNILGATAIEDKLQEGVPETIEELLRADIKVWVITGDKKETAQNVAYSVHLISGNMNVITLDIENEASLIGKAQSAIAEPIDALIISGASLQTLLLPAFEDLLFSLASKCKAVVCCRVSPIQKAAIVKLVRSKTGDLCLAIGDGANDVGMITEADVGIGISGKEGRQAVLASDYAIAQFRFLKRLLFLHGRTNFIRNTDLVFYSFYKNIAFSFNQMIFAIFSGFSGNTMYDGTLYMSYNIFFTSVPCVIYACFERDVSKASMMEIPELYTLDGRKNWYQSYGRFVLFLVLGVFQGAVAFFVSYFGLGSASDGSVYGMKEFGITVFSCIIVIVNVRIALMCANWTWLHFLFIFASVLIFYPIAVLFDKTGASADMKGLTMHVFGSLSYYSCILAATIAATIPVIIGNVYTNTRNTLTNKVLHLERKKWMIGDKQIKIDGIGGRELPKKEN